jgi:hypothetical protein
MCSHSFAPSAILFDLTRVDACGETTNAAFSIQADFLLTLLVQWLVINDKQDIRTFGAAQATRVRAK